MGCQTCDQAERTAVHRAKMVERDGHVAVVAGVPMEERPACGVRMILRRLVDSGAETATAHWSDLAPTAA